MRWQQAGRTTAGLVISLVILHFLWKTAAYGQGDECAEGQHDYHLTEAFNATESEDGRMVYTCSLCGHFYAEIIPSTGHVWSDWVIEREPSCLNGGRRYRVCFNGTPHYQYEDLEAVGHTYEVKIIGATCTEDGREVYTCTSCGDSYTGLYIEKKGHSYIREVVKEADCESEGLLVTYCENCDQREEEIIPLTGHHYGSWLVDAEPSEGKAGMRHRVCENCGDVIKEALEALPETTIMPEVKEPEQAPFFNKADIVIASTNTGLIIFFVLLTMGELSAFGWNKRRREQRIKQLEKDQESEREEEDGFDII